VRDIEMIKSVYLVMASNDRSCWRVDDIPCAPSMRLSSYVVEVLQNNGISS